MHENLQKTAQGDARVKDDCIALKTTTKSSLTLEAEFWLAYARPEQMREK